jgi:plastocyanin
MKTIGALLILVCAGLAVAVSVARPAIQATQLDAKVGPGYTISLLQNGAKVTHLAPGDYTITVVDASDIHNFHLFGPGVSEATDVETTGTTTWNVTFQNGTYTYDCDAHPASMIGRFTVGDTPPTTTVAPPPLKVHATAKATGHVVTVRALATRAAKYDITLWRGTKKIAHAAKSTLRYANAKPGRYVAKVVAKSGTSTAKAVAAATVK